MAVSTISVQAQNVDFGRGFAAGNGGDHGARLSEGLGGPADEVDGLRSSLDDGARRVRQNSRIAEDDQRTEDMGDDDFGDDDAGSRDGGSGDDRDPRDRGFRGEVDSRSRAVLLDGELNGQYARGQGGSERRQGLIEPVRDGDYGVLIRDDDGEAGDPGRDDRVGNEALLGPVGDLASARSGAEADDIDVVSDRYGNGDLDDGRAARRSARDRAPGPYEPLGLRAGSFLVYPEAIISGVFVDNVREASGSKDSDEAFEFRPSIRVRSQWRRHSLEVDAEGTGRFYKEFGTEDDREFLTNLRGRLDITRRTNIESEAGYSLSQQSRGTADSPAGAVENPDVHVWRAALALNHRFNRLSLRLRGEVVDETYDDVDVIGGGESDEGDQDNREDAFSLRGTYELDPALSIFAEGLVERRNFAQVSNSDGISRDQDGLGFRAGILFDNGSKIYGELALGIIHVSADDRRLNDVDGVTFDANVTWRPSELTTISLDASTDIDATTVAGSLAALNHTANLRVSHEVLRRFILSAGVGIDHVDYKGVRLVERTYRAQLGAEYILNRFAAMIAAYDYAAFRSNSPGSDYESSQLRLGMRLRR